MAKEIKLTQGKIALIDDEDFNYVNQYSWHYNIHGYAKSRIKNPVSDLWKLHYMHRFILQAEKGQYVDHINGNKLDNQRNNLRICTNQQNAISARLGKNNTTGFKGITWDKPRKKWIAKIMHNRKTVHIGAFLSKEEAAKAYDVKATELFGEFALTNKMLGLY